MIFHNHIAKHYEHWKCQYSSKQLPYVQKCHYPPLFFPCSLFLLFLISLFITIYNEFNLSPLRYIHTLTYVYTCTSTCMYVHVTKTDRCWLSTEVGSGKGNKKVLQIQFATNSDSLFLDPTKLINTRRKICSTSTRNCVCVDKYYRVAHSSRVSFSDVLQCARHLNLNYILNIWNLILLL